VVKGNNCLDEQFTTVLAKALSKLPRGIVDWSVLYVVFISPPSKEIAFSIHKRSDLWIIKRGFVFLSSGLLKEPEEKQAFVIAHEIAHLKLNHHIPHYSPEEEEKANDLAKKWLSQ